MLEPFNTAIDKKFLYGKTADCVFLLESLKKKAANLRIELDIAHIPLIGESYEDAIKTVSPEEKFLHRNS